VNVYLACPRTIARVELKPIEARLRLVLAEVKHIYRPCEIEAAIRRPSMAFRLNLERLTASTTVVAVSGWTEDLAARREIQVALWSGSTIYEQAGTGMHQVILRKMNDQRVAAILDKGLQEQLAK